MPPRRQSQPPKPESPPSVSEDDSSENDSNDSSSGSEPEVTLNILERQPRITAGKRTKAVLTGEEETVDRAFWGSEQHRTWEESESDSDVSFDLDEEDEDESESDSELDDEEKDESSEEDESEDEETRKKQQRGRFQAYKPVSVRDADAPKRKTIVRRKAKPVQEPTIAPDERRETRDSTRARTMEVQERSTPATTRKITRRPSDGPKILTQEQLMEEARIVEEWNKADLDAYIKYTEMSEKEKNAMMQKRRRGVNKNEFTIFSRSFIDKRGEVSSELRLVPPPAEEPALKKKTIPAPPKSTNQILGIHEREAPATRSGFTYRYPYGGEEGFNTVSEYKAIRADYVDYESREIRKVINQIHSLLETSK